MRNDSLINAVRSYLQAAEYLDSCRAEGADDFVGGEELERARRNVEAQINQAEATAVKPGTIRSIMVAVEDVEHDAPVVTFAGRLARDLQATLILLHVHEPMSGVSAEAGYASVADFEHARFRARELLTTIQNLLPEGVHSEPVLREGAAANEILAAARELHADLIVVGTHGPGRFEQLLMGSTANTVARESICPVVVINRRAKKSLATLSASQPAYVSS